MNEIDLKVVTEGEEAERVLDNPAYQRAITAVKGQIFNQWCGATAPKEREELWRMQRCVDVFEQELAQMVDGKKLAEASQTVTQLR